LASIAFVVSVAPKANTLRRHCAIRRARVPALIYTNAMIWDVAHAIFTSGVAAVALPNFVPDWEVA